MPKIAIAPCRAMTDYLESVRREGADPYELALSDLPPDAQLAEAGGLMLTGGGDVDPALYGQAPHATYAPADPGRDAHEIALVRAAMGLDLPILAICRGMQVLNVALGGTLVQDIPSMVNGAVEHNIREPRYQIAHEVWISKDTRLATLMGDLLEGGDTTHVNSRHHQAVDRVADGWVVTATAPDGVVEAMEAPGDVFRVAVQWHPENFWRTGEFRRLFEGFVKAASARAGA
ncbi:MAG: gamma-glutamyl-gamma-aminobutyrate hydrolase family protein [Vicinamibacterales bacterium]